MIEATKLTKEEFASFKPINNNVIIECIIPKEEIRPSGLIIPKDVDYFIANSVESANHIDTSAHLDRYGIVTKVPDKLIYNPKKGYDWLMPWETEVEVQVGEMVWFDYYHGKHCPFIQVENKMYRMINYRYLIVAKHSIMYSVADIIADIVLPLNGFCLFEQVFESPSSQLIVDKHLNKKQGIVKYLGNRNKSYVSRKRFDDIDLQVGDKVIFRNETECLLENENHYKFDNVPLRYNQRADVLGIIN